MSDVDAYGRSLVGRQKVRCIQKYIELIEEKKKLEEEMKKPVEDDYFGFGQSDRMDALVRLMEIDGEIEEAQEQQEAMQAGDYSARKAAEYTNKRVMHRSARQ